VNPRCLWYFCYAAAESLHDVKQVAIDGLEIVQKVNGHHSAVDIAIAVHDLGLLLAKGLDGVLEPVALLLKSFRLFEALLVVGAWIVKKVGEDVVDGQAHLREPCGLHFGFDDIEGTRRGGGGGNMFEACGGGFRILPDRLHETDEERGEPNKDQYVCEQSCNNRDW